MTIESKIFTSDEIGKLIDAFAEGQKEFTEDQAADFVEWCKKTRIANALIEMVLSGKIVASIGEEDYQFSLKKVNK